MKNNIISIKYMVYLIGAFLFITYDFELAYFDWVWFALFSIAFLFPRFKEERESE